MVKCPVRVTVLVSTIERQLCLEVWLIAYGEGRSCGLTHDSIRPLVALLTVKLLSRYNNPEADNYKEIE